MLLQIISHTPVWVWALLASLLVLGTLQTRQRSVSLTRLVALPLVMVGLSLLGVFSAFHGNAMAALLWAATATITAALMLKLPLSQGTRYDASTRSFDLPGSWLPMALILGIFATKYAVGVSLVMHPALADSASFSYAISALYGAMSGIFSGRTLRLIRLVKPRPTIVRGVA